MNVRRLLTDQIERLWGAGELELVRRNYLPDIVDHMPVPGQLGGLDGMEQVVREFRAAMRGQKLRAVGIGHDGFEQLHALQYAALDVSPLCVGEQQREQVLLLARQQVLVVRRDLDGAHRDALAAVIIRREPGRAREQRRQRHRADPIVLHDLFFRIGGAAPGQVNTALRIHAHDTLVDHTWLWRADHGAGVGWASNPAAHGLWVEGEDVTIYGLFVEHFQQAQVVWRGNGGRVYFYQSELPYDPPTQPEWMSATGRGHPSYVVDPAVTRHEAWGLGIYSVFLQPDVRLDRAIEAPRAPGVRFQHMITVCLVDKGSIERVINDAGEPARCQGGSNTATLKAWP